MARKEKKISSVDIDRQMITTAFECITFLEVIAATRFNHGEKAVVAATKQIRLMYTRFNQRVESDARKTKNA